jgi:hypothetical protein
MYTFNGIVEITVIAITLVLINVLLHYEALNFLSSLLEKISRAGRSRIAILICCLIIVHILEIWIFAGGIILAEKQQTLGYIHGVEKDNILDYVYYSSMTYTTVGFGDVSPIGPLRFVAAIESLLGLMLITWSASFTYLEMKRFWENPRRS